MSSGKMRSVTYGEHIAQVEGAYRALPWWLRPWGWWRLRAFRRDVARRRRELPAAVRRAAARLAAVSRER